MKKAKKIVKHNWFLRLIKAILKTFKKRPKLIMEELQLPEQAIYIANHSGAAGPLTLSMYFPKYLVPWGAHPMTENYKHRWKYLYYVFYQQKLKYSKFRSFILATLFGLISKILYKGVQLIPTYTDLRLRHSISKSIEHLEVGNSLLIFPEDSEDGYEEEIKKFHSGFVYLAQKYYQVKEKHIPIIPLYYHKEKAEVRVGKQYFLKDFKSTDHRSLISDFFKNVINELGYN
ncbi:hypothetical protein HF295_02520 [Hujiaoplasma nucleasis]|uniref:Phospholipid/glycerol acyltransferase domain-containing protein n=1 Tax=Hujiaoplasma nucleasis TaxID=2725268 RepID=A0A7L6N0L5_9MOLU|nr:1-acyl-sn-glycerol-3-phosphate acyltransferase [Hujiaoplasma nucleasis]QLY39796.1 hypothetical protein HF295_02520 [Hujiaoplasma nucleasis]